MRRRTAATSKPQMTHGDAAVIHQSMNASKSIGPELTVSIFRETTGNSVNRAQRFAEQDQTNRQDRSFDV